jgi:nitroreductase
MAGMFREGSDGHTAMRALELESASISVAMAVQNLLLSATEQGLGTCVMTGPLIASGAIDRIVQVPDGWKILCIVPVGYPDETPDPTSRKSVDRVLIHPKIGGS